MLPLTAMSPPSPALRRRTAPTWASLTSTELVQATASRVVERTTFRTGLMKSAYGSSAAVLPGQYAAQSS
jgi:hypothetical protein